MSSVEDPHADLTIERAGTDPLEAAATLILLHGRGASAAGMLNLYKALNLENIAAIAPEAAGNSWYPQSFLAPLPLNQPYLDSALSALGDLVDRLMDSGIPSSRIALLGFSQGACLTCEFISRHPRRYGAVMALTGGLIGPPGVKHSHSGSLSGTPVFLGTSDPDIHIPIARVHETKMLLRGMGGVVEMRRYPGMPHTVNDDELDVCRTMLQSIVD